MSIEMLGNGRQCAEELLHELRSAEAQGENLSDGDFQTILRRVFDRKILTPSSLSRRLIVGLPTIERWQRVAAPSPKMRPSVIARIIEEVGRTAHSLP